MSDKTRFIVRAAMTEYMTLISGALLLYGALQIWPHAITLVAFLGGFSIAALCIINFILVMRTSNIAPPRHSHEPPRKNR